MVAGQGMGFYCRILSSSLLSGSLCCNSLAGSCHRLTSHLFPSLTPPISLGLSGSVVQEESSLVLQPGAMADPSSVLSLTQS